MAGSTAGFGVFEVLRWVGCQQHDLVPSSRAVLMIRVKESPFFNRAQETLPSKTAQGSDVRWRRSCRFVGGRPKRYARTQRERDMM
jgi:hypothetical protein